MNSLLTRLAAAVILITASSFAPSASVTPVPRQPTPSARDVIARIEQAGRDYPPEEHTAWMSVQTELTRQAADDLRVRFPDSPETVDLLLRAGRVHDALHVTRTIVDTRPDRLPAAATVLARHWSVLRTDDDARPHLALLKTIMTDARERSRALTTEEAALVAVRLTSLDITLVPRSAPPEELAARWRAVAAEHAGTAAALEAGLAAVSAAQPTGGAARADALDAFARAHAGTCAAGRALLMKAQAIVHGDARASRPGEDPTERFLQAFATARALEGPAYATCEWNDDGPDQLAARLFGNRPAYAPDNVGRLLAAYREYVTRRFRVDAAYPVLNGVGWMITGRMGELFAVQGDRRRGIEQTLTALEQTVPDAAGVRYLRAQYYADRARRGDTLAERQAFVGDAKTALASVAGDAASPYRDHALAGLAWLHLSYGEYGEALVRFREYVARRPGSHDTWVAQMRAAQCLEAQDGWSDAASFYLAAAQGTPRLRMARVLGQAYAGRAYEAGGRFPQALAAYRAALADWPDVPEEGSAVRRFGGASSFRLPAFRVRTDVDRDSFTDITTRTDPTIVARHALSERAERLRRQLAAPGGDRLARAYWLLERGRRAEAADVAAGVSADLPGSPNAEGARLVVSLARVGDALDLARAGTPNANDEEALRLLDEVTQQPFDFGVCAALISRAVLQARRTDTAGPRDTFIDALARWQQHARGREPDVAANDLERDVAAIRDLVFRPAGDGPYAGTRWNGFRWPETPARFVVTRPHVDVALADGREMRVRVRAPRLAPDNALTFDDDEIVFFTTLIRTLGGTATRAPQAVMETPHQPVGGSVDVMRFLNHGFLVMPGHWGGWELYTFPVITLLEFTDPARRSARAHVTIGYGGGEVYLEKRGDAWRLVRVVRTWVT